MIFFLTLLVAIGKNMGDKNCKPEESQTVLLLLLGNCLRVQMQGFAAWCTSHK